MINSHCHMAIIVVMIWSAGYQNVPCVLGLAYKLQSLVKGKSHYAVMGVYSPTDKGKCAVSENKSLILPCNVKKSVPQMTDSNSNPDISLLLPTEAHSLKGKG